MPEGAKLDAVTGDFAWTPGPGQSGDYVVMVKLTTARHDRIAAGAAGHADTDLAGGAHRSDAELPGRSGQA